MKRILLLALVALLAGSAYAETRDVNPTILNTFDRGFAPFTSTVGPTGASGTFVPMFIDRGANDGATINDSPAMYTGQAIGDLAFISVEYDGGTGVTVPGWTEVPCSGQTTTGSTLEVYYQILESTNPTRLVVVNGADHISHYTWGITGGSFDAADPFEVDCSQADLGSTATPASVSIDTVNDNSMVVTVFGTARDQNVTSPFVANEVTTGSTYAPWTGAANSVNSTSWGGKNQGNGGASQNIMGLQETAGATGVVSGTCVADYLTTITFAINGEQS